MHTAARIRNHAILASIAAIAFIVACVSHEAIGHGGACLAGGGTIAWLTSVYFQCSNGGAWVAAAGPATNLVVGAICWWLLRSNAANLAIRMFLVLAMAFNLFWGAGYFIFSAATNSGDWAWVLRDLGLGPLWLWRASMGVLGVFIYARSVRSVSNHWPVGVSFVTPYVAAGVVACGATFFYLGPMLPALREGAQESFVAAVGLLLLAGRRQRAPAEALDFSAPGNCWLFLAALIVFAFWLTLGRGFGIPAHA
jgi:hypothetical protein